MKILDQRSSNRLSRDAVIRLYQHAKRYVVMSGYSAEIDWQANVSFENVGEKYFLSELAWVILCTGMREAIIRKYFNVISFCFFDWESAKKVVERYNFCCERALRVFNNPRKIKAILESCELIVEVGFDNLKQGIVENPLDTLRVFPYIGPVTSYHLAKNLGIPVAKPDRHLIRICRATGFQNVQELCNEISRETGDLVQVVDLVLWRYATLRRCYMSDFELVAGGISRT